MFLGGVAPAGNHASAAGELVDGVGQAVFIDRHAELFAWVMKDDGVSGFLALKARLSFCPGLVLLLKPLLLMPEADRLHTLTNR